MAEAFSIAASGGRRAVSGPRGIVIVGVMIRDVVISIREVRP